MLRRIVTTFALLCFVLQGFATQTHIHYLTQAGGFASPKFATATLVANAAPDRDESPSVPSDNPAHCAFCQEFLLAGAFVAPAVIATPVPAQITTVAHSLAITFAIAQELSHGWSSRGPPLT